MFRKITLVSLVVFGSVLLGMIGKCFADASPDLEQAKSSIISLIKDCNYAQAQTQTQKLLAGFPEDPCSPKALYEIAETFLLCGASDRDKDKYGRAGEVYQQIIANYPDSRFAGKAALGIAKTKVRYFIVAQDYDAAGQALNEMVANFSQEPNLPDELYWIGRGYGYWERHEEEKVVYQQIIQNYPDNPYADRARVGFAKASIQSLIMSQDYDGAKQALDKLIVDFSAHPDLPESLYWIAERYAWSDRYEDAKSLHQKIITDFPDSPIVTGARLGFSKVEVLSLISRKEYENAEQIFGGMFTNFRDHPDFPRAVLAIGEQSYKQGLSKEGEDLSQAMELYEMTARVCDELINKLPDSSLVPEACRGTGLSYFKLGKYQESAGYFQKVVNDYPQYEFAWSAQSWLGGCYEKLRDSGAMPDAEAKMEQAYEAVIEKYPDCPSVGNACLKLAELGFKRNQPTEAAAYLELFLEKSPEDDHRIVNALYDLGRAYEQMGEMDLAVEAYEKFLTKAERGNPHISEVQAKLENMEGAGK